MIFLLALSIYLGPVEPIDIPKFDCTWRYVHDTTRIRIGKLYLRHYSLYYIASCLSALRIEQPPHKKIPDNNCSGVHAWSKRYPYGWRNYFKKARCRPVGWYNAVEGMTGNLVPYLKFKYYAENFLFSLGIFINRHISDGGRYNEKWVGCGGYHSQFDEYRDFYCLELIKG